MQYNAFCIIQTAIILRFEMEVGLASQYKIDKD